MSTTGTLGMHLSLASIPFPALQSPPQTSWADPAFSEGGGGGLMAHDHGKGESAGGGPHKVW